MQRTKETYPGQFSHNYTRAVNLARRPTRTITMTRPRPRPRPRRREFLLRSVRSVTLRSSTIIGGEKRFPCTHTVFYTGKGSQFLSPFLACLSVSLFSFPLSVSYTTKREPRGRWSDETAVGGVRERPSEKRQTGASETVRWLRHNRDLRENLSRMTGVVGHDT